MQRVKKSQAYFSLSLAILATIPGLVLRLVPMHAEFNPLFLLLLTGCAILGASFLLTWACEVAQMDIPQTLALAVVAFIAVLPEYAVDMYFTWMAGQDPASEYSHYAIANMTGANRLLIGIGWSLIAILFWLRYKSQVFLDKERRTEMFFLAAATVYAFIIPIKGSLVWYDSIVLIGIYVFYIKVISKRPTEEEECEGVAALLAHLPPQKRRWITWGSFLFAALVILANAEPFSESLVASGKFLGIDEFLLVQWLAPVASEAPEFIVAILFALRAKANLALGSLLSSKLNQWTLLVGMIPLVFALSSGSFAQPIPMNSHQMSEILLTAAQSLFAIAVLLKLNLGPKGAFALLALFLAQFTAPLYQPFLETLMQWPPKPDRLHDFYSLIYIVLGAVLVIRHRKFAWQLKEGLRA